MIVISIGPSLFDPPMTQFEPEMAFKTLKNKSLTKIFFVAIRLSSLS